MFSPSPDVKVNSHNTNSIYENGPSSSVVNTPSSFYNPDYHFLWLLLIPLLIVGGCLYNRKCRNNSAVCPKNDDKKYETDNVVNIEEGSKRNNHNLTLQQESSETVKTREESPHQYPFSPRRRRNIRRLKTLNTHTLPPAIVKSPRPRRIKSAPTSQHRPPSKTLLPTSGQPMPPTVPPRTHRQSTPTVPPRKNKNLLVSV
jgi:hypothetical protein